MESGIYELIERLTARVEELEAWRNKQMHAQPSLFSAPIALGPAETAARLAAIDEEQARRGELLERLANLEMWRDDQVRQQDKTKYARMNQEYNAAETERMQQENASRTEYRRREELDRIRRNAEDALEAAQAARRVARRIDRGY